MLGHAKAERAAAETKLPDARDAGAISELLAEVFLQGWMSIGVPSGTRR
jgi:hypothetical protein